MKKIITYVSFALLSIVLFWLGYSYHWFWPLMLVFLIPLLHLIYRHELKYRQLFVLAATVGIGCGATIMFWYWQVLPLDWAGINNPAVEILLVLYVWVISSIPGALFGFWIILFKWLKRDTGFDLLLIPAMWVALEWFRAWAVTLFLFGEGGLIGPHWTNGFTGNALASSNLTLPLGSLGGVYLMSFVAILFNSLIYFTLLAFKEKRDWKKYARVLAGLTLAVSLFSASYYWLPAKKYETMQVAVANTYRASFSGITEEQAIKNLGVVLELLGTIKPDQRSPDIIILPEDSRVVASLKMLGVEKAIKAIAGDKETLIIDSARVIDPLYKAPTLKFFFLNTKTGRLDESDKIFLTPHGEYMPYITEALLNITGNQRWVETFKGLRQVSRGKQIQLTNFKGIKLGAVACLEVMSSEVNSKLVSGGAAFLVNTASHSLFNGSSYLYDQIFNMSKIRAVENNRYYVQAGNFVPSFVLDNKGRLKQESAWSKNSILYQDVEIVTQPSIYNRVGRSLMALSIFSIIALVIIQKFNLVLPRLPFRLKK